MGKIIINLINTSTAMTITVGLIGFTGKRSVALTEADLNTLDWGEGITNENGSSSPLNSGFSPEPAFSREKTLTSYTEDDILEMSDLEYTNYLARGGLLSLEKINYIASNEYKEEGKNFSMLGRLSGETSIK